MSSKQETLDHILGAENTDKSVMSQAVLEVLRTATDEEERNELMAHAMVHRDDAAKHATSLRNKGLTDEAWQHLLHSYADLISAHLKMAFYQSNNAKEFAGKALRLLDLVDGDDEQTFVISGILFSPYVPYMQLPGEIVQMSTERFSHLIQSNKEKANLIRYVIGIPFTKTTELASLVLPVLDDEPNKEVRVGLLAFCFGSIMTHMKGD